MLSFRNKLVKTDPEVIRQIAASTGFFDRQDVQINVEIAENLLNQKDSEHKFLFADYMDKTVAYVCYGEAPDAKEGTYEIYWLSTLNEYRGLGIGRNLINKLITKLRKKGAKKIYVKTDSKDQYAPTRRFYNKCGFKLQAVLPGYYDDNDNCCIYALDLTEKDALGLFPDEYVAAE